VIDQGIALLVPNYGLSLGIWRTPCVPTGLAGVVHDVADAEQHHHGDQSEQQRKASHKRPREMRIPTPPVNAAATLKEPA